MSSDYIRLQDSQLTKESQPTLNNAVTSINDSYVNQEDYLDLYKSTRGLTFHEDGINDIDAKEDLAKSKTFAQKEDTNFNNDDEKIKDYFQKEET